MTASAGTVAAIIQARMGSTRLPGKVLDDLGGQPVLAWMVRAARAIPGVDAVIVATGDGDANDPVADWCEAAGVPCHRGSEQDVLSRFAGAAAAVEADVILRLTADTPFLDPAVCGQVLWLQQQAGADYAANVDPPTWPDGLDCEAFTRRALDAAAAEAAATADREHVTPWIRNNRSRFRAVNLTCPLPGLQERRWTLDTPEDLAWLRRLADRLAAESSGDRVPSWFEVLRAEDDLIAAGAAACTRRPGRNEALQRAVGSDGVAAPSQISFDASLRQLERAEALIPLGSQTFSKSRVQFPAGAAPLFVTHGDGGRTWDVDGNEYVDMVCGLLCTLLGHRDPDVDAAVRAQLDRGIGFSLATELEADLAERIVDIVPSVEQVRFAKNGSDATAAAVRIARAATGRDRIIACGYHGWQDWYIGATSRDRGVPAAVRELTHMAPYNDLNAVRDLFRAHSGEVAALVMEPMAAVWPEDGYLGSLAELVRGEGAVLIFDEIITGFRFAPGGAQAYFGVKPDLTALGKGLGNGLPISVIGGRTDLMAEMERVFVSGTFGGEALSLAAAIAVVDKIRREPVIETLWQTGHTLRQGVESVLDDRGLSDVIRLNGADPWVVFGFADHAAGSALEIKTLLLTELAARGLLTVGSHNICYAHSAADISRALAAWSGAADCLAEAIDTGSVRQSLKTPPLEPVFRVR